MTIPWGNPSHGQNEELPGHPRSPSACGCKRCIVTQNCPPGLLESPFNAMGGVVPSAGLAS